MDRTPRHSADHAKARESLAMGPNTTQSPRVFTDDKGRLWNATHTGEAIVFTCVSDSRQSGRAIAVDVVNLNASVDDQSLRAWLNAAPRIGTLP